MSAASQPRMVNCPNCRTPVAWSIDNPYRPFCCERCKLIDIGKWASDEYTIPVTPDFTEDESPTSLH